MSDDQSIKISANGPYLVAGSVPLRRKQPIVSEHGEPLTWKTSEPLETNPVYALCRCGQSENKPFCDGAHARVDFDGTETASSDDYEQRRASLGGEGIEVFDDRGICAHAGFCGNEASNIWKMAEQTGDTQIRAQAIAMVERCPSGALTYAIEDDIVEPDLPVGVSLITDGPIWVGGGISVTRSDEQPVEVRNRVTLCRCGQSGNKPFCDGSHFDAGFKG